MTHLNDLEITISSIMDGERDAVIDNESMIRLNYESYFFASKREKERFAKSPTEYCGALTDPVSKQRFIPIENSPKFEFNDRVFYFLSEDNQEMFAAMPDSFALAGFKMMKMEDRMMGMDPDAQD